MDAKYDLLMDSMAVRLTLNTVALLLWIAVPVGVLEFAVKCRSFAAGARLSLWLGQAVRRSYAVEVDSSLFDINRRPNHDPRRSI